jgi:hypothetical protein
MKKSKWDIIGADLDKDNHEEHYNDFFYFWYDGVDPSGLYYGEDYIYEYLEPVYQDYVSKRGIRVTIERLNIGSYIDMMSIYSPQVLRQMKIDYLLGIDVWEITKIPTIGDILKMKIENEN